MITHHAPADQKAIGDELSNSSDRQLHSNSFIHDESNPDSLLSYEAGGMSEADISTTPDLSRDIGNPDAINQPADIGSTPAATDAWLSVLGALRGVTVIDEKSKKSMGGPNIQEDSSSPEISVGSR